MQKQTKQRKYRLTVYLIKENCSCQSDILKDSSGLKQYAIKNHSKTEMPLYVKIPRANPPSWLHFFDGYIEQDLSDLFNSSNSAVLIVKHNQRYFAYTFGYGHSLLNPNYIEESFGLKCALNSINQDKIRSVNIKNLDTISRLSKVQTSQAASVDNFGMNIDRDILNAVTGVSNDEAFGKQLTGSVSLHLSVPVTIDDLLDLCAKLLNKFKDKSYKNNFPWVDHISEVKNTSLINELNDSLIKTIKGKDFERIYLAVPELVDWEQIEGFKYKQSDDLKEDIHIFDILPPDEEIEEKITLEWLHRKRVSCIGKDNEQVIHSWPFYNCINFEFEKDQETYLLTGGKWFKIDTNYVNSVNKEVLKIDEYKRFHFPQYVERREDTYNEKVFGQNKQKCFLMDKQNIRHGEGRNQIEFCDLIIDKKDFVHVKRFRGSSALSHLFLQGLNSAFLFLTDRQFLVKVNKILPDEWRFNGGSSIKASDYEVVFAVISKASGGVKDIIPFFSKVSLLHVYKQLRAYGYKVSLTKIDMQ